ncbi:MAG: outer membrane lipoprotein carrier protein LolA [Candidatus Zixiibacteriota bacterium]|jgi:outer membrane lipoprotein carrier protein
MKRTSLNIALACTLVVYAAAPSAAVWPYDEPPSVDAAELLDRITAKYEKLDDFRSDVAVVTSSAYLGETSTSRGVLYAKMPNLVRVEFDEPFEQLIVYDGDRMYAHVAGSKQVIRYRGAEVAYLADLPGALDELSEDYDVELVSETAGQVYELRLTARNGTAAAFGEIRLWVGRDDLLGRRCDFYDAAGSCTSYRLSNYRLNPGLSADLFVFKIPAGAEIVDMAGP